MEASAKAVLPAQVTGAAKAVLETKKWAHIRESAMRSAITDLGLDRTWSFKVWRLFPLLAMFRQADWHARYIFPLAYMIFLVAVTWPPGEGQRGIDVHGWSQLIESSPCGRKAVLGS